MKVAGKTVHELFFNNNIIILKIIPGHARKPLDMKLSSLLLLLLNAYKKITMQNQNRDRIGLFNQYILHLTSVFFPNVNSI